LNYLSDLT